MATSVNPAGEAVACLLQPAGYNHHVPAPEKKYVTKSLYMLETPKLMDYVTCIFGGVGTSLGTA